MPYLRYILQSTHSQETLAMKFNLENGYVTLGGNTKFLDTMYYIVEEVFGSKLPNGKMTQKNKIRFEFRSTISKFTETLEQLKTLNFIVEKTPRLYRIMS